MEGPVMAVLRVRLCLAVGLCCLINWTSSLTAQDPPASGQAEINFPRSAQTRPFQGRDVEGEERQGEAADRAGRLGVGRGRMALVTSTTSSRRTTCWA